MCAGLGGSLPAAHLHQPLPDGDRRANPPQRGIPETWAYRNVDEDVDADALLVVLIGAPAPSSSVYTIAVLAGVHHCEVIVV